MEKIYFDTIDECIMAAYQHVKLTKSIVSFADSSTLRSGITNEVGLKSSDGYYFMLTMENNYKFQEKPLCNLILDNHVKILDVINKQLLAFL